jgi:hypothetical protein
MKTFKIISVIIFSLVFQNENRAQLYVSNNSFVYNKGALVYVKDYVNLNGTNSNFYLRREGQLLQGTTGTSSNTGTGKLSVFQEGTVNNYAYNYWCSPIGNASSSVGNENFGITMLNQPTGLTSFNTANPIGGFDGTTNNSALNIAKYWIWKYISSNVYDPGGLGWIHVQDASTISPGQGFTMKGSTSVSVDNTDVGEKVVNNPLLVQVNNPGNNQRYDFRGKPNDGNIDVTVGNNNYTLTGNPYPSALHVNAFLLDFSNSNCTRIAYYWEQDKSINSHLLLAYRGGYGTYSPVSLVSNGVYLPATFDSYNSDGTLNTVGSSSGLSIYRKYAPIGQGFMIRGVGLGTTVTLKNSHRFFYRESDQTTGFNLSQFERVSNTSPNQTLTNSNDVPHIRINAIMNNQVTRQVALILIPDATDDVDPGIDALSPGEETLPNDIYFYLDNNRYVIEGVNFDVNKRIPIGIKASNNATFKFSVSHVINFDQNQPVYIYDGLDNSYHNIKDGNYEITLPEGIYNNRFEVTFIDQTLNINNSIKENLQIIQNNNLSQLMISNPNLLDTNAIKLYDINGKVVFNKEKLGTQASYSFPTSGFADGVYIVNISTKDNQSLSQKIIIKNKK